MKTIQECASFIRRLERRIPVNEWALDGTRIWPFLRTVLFYRLSISLRGAEDARPESRVRARLRRLAGSLVAPWKDRARNLPAAAPADVFVLTYSGTRQACIDGRYVDIRTGPIIDFLASQGVRTHTWEYAAPLPYRFPRQDFTHPVQGTFDVAQLGSRLFGGRIGRIELTGYGGFCDALASEGVCYPELLEGTLLREFKLIFALRDRFERAFDRITPALAFTSNLGRYEFALHLACRRRNIPTVEVQHGVQGPLHAQYADWTRVPREGYDLLPHAYWCWDEASASTINQWSEGCSPRHHAVVGGNPWLDYCAARVNAPAAAPEGRKVGLITLQPPEKIYSDGRLLPEFVLDALSACDRSWLWWVRPHPASSCDTSSLAAELRRRGIDAEIEDVRIAPLPSLLARSAIHLTHSSSTVVEAAQLRVESVVWSDLGASLYAPQIESGWCRVARDRDELARTIGRTSNAPKTAAKATPVPLRETLAPLIELGRRMTGRPGARINPDSRREP